MLKMVNINQRANLLPDLRQWVNDLDGVRDVVRRWDGQRMTSYQETIAFYRPTVQLCTELRMRYIAILDQQWEGDGGYEDGRQPPWWDSNAISWNEYAMRLTESCAMLATAWRGLNVVYQVWNEQDKEWHPETSSL